MTAKGHGAVNYDSSENQSALIAAHKWEKSVGHLVDHNNNVSLAKKVFYFDENGDFAYNLKVSTECVKKSITGGSVNQSIMADNVELYNWIMSPMSILSGFLFANKNKNISLKKKSAVTITPFVECGNAVSHLEFHSSGTGEKRKTADANVTDNSIHKKESIGETQYTSVGKIDVQELSFMSGDESFDRKAFDSDNINLILNVLEKNGEKPSYGYFSKIIPSFFFKTNYIGIPELGIRFSDDFVKNIIREFFARLLSSSIRKGDALFEIDSLEIKLVTNIIDQRIDDEEGWVKLGSLNDVVALDFEVPDVYQLQDFEKTKYARELLSKNFQAMMQKPKK